MAYTYDDFIKAANGAGVMDRFSTDDLAVAQKNPEYGLSMVGLMGDLSKATTAEQRLLATEAVNQLRKNYGISGTGSSFVDGAGSQAGQPMDKVQNSGSFTYSQDNAYKQLLDSVAKPGSFSYDPATDPSFQSYKKAYLREGERASANALAQASAASGGVPSSFAVNAAQQAGNYYAGQLADAVPALEQNAYQRYLNDYNAKLSGLSALQSDRNFDYQKYLDQVAEKQQQFENALTMYNLLGYATPEIAAVLGIPASENPEANGQTGVYYGPGPQDGPQDGPQEVETTLSTDGQKFMTTLPYAHAGSSPEAWKNFVNQKLAAAYENGALNENDVAIIAAQLKLYE